MTYDELIAIAARKGTLRWNKSGIIEHVMLSSGKRPGIIARVVKQSAWHFIGKHDTYDCIEVDSKTKEPVHANDGASPRPST